MSTFASAIPPPLAALRRVVLSEPRRPASVRANRWAPWLAVATVCVGAFMGQLDVSIVTVALPRIGADLRVGAGLVQWVSLGYLLVLVCALVAVGRLADRLGRKLLYTYGFAVFTLGSALCALAPGLGWLLAARVLQGAGAAMLQANSVALIAETLPRAELARGTGLQGAAQAIGLALGPAVGGVLLGIGGWRLIFLVNVPVGFVGIALGWLLLPRSRSRAPRERFDGAGALLLALTAGAGMLAISLARQDMPAPLLPLALLGLALAAGAALVRRERRVAAPLLDPRLLRRAGVARGLACAAVAYIAMFGALYALPYYLAANHVPSALAGLELAILPAALGIAALLSGHLVPEGRRAALAAAGLGVAACGLLLLAVDHAAAARTAALALIGAGVGAFVPLNNASVMAAAPPVQVGAMSGVLNTTRGLATALGVALAGTLYQLAAGAGVASGLAAGRGLALSALALAAIAAAGALLSRWPSAPGVRPPRRARRRRRRAAA
jgi:EmrB/QacA subfamily drug resistance transporter